MLEKMKLQRITYKLLLMILMKVKKLKKLLIVLVMTVSVTGCGSSSVKPNELKFDLIEPTLSDDECMSDKLVEPAIEA